MGHCGRKKTGEKIQWNKICGRCRAKVLRRLHLTEKKKKSYRGMAAQKGKQNTQTRKESTMWPLLEDNRTSFQILNVRWHISKSIKYCIFNGLGSIPWPKGANRTGLDASQALRTSTTLVTSGRIRSKASKIERQIPTYHLHFTSRVPKNNFLSYCLNIQIWSMEKFVGETG